MAIFNSYVKLPEGTPISPFLPNEVSPEDRHDWRTEEEVEENGMDWRRARKCCECRNDQCLGPKKSGHSFDDMILGLYDIPRLTKFDNAVLIMTII